MPWYKPGDLPKPGWLGVIDGLPVFMFCFLWLLVRREPLHRVTSPGIKLPPRQDIWTHPSTTCPHSPTGQPSVAAVNGIAALRGCA